MTDGLLLPPGVGDKVQAGMTLKVGESNSDVWSAFEAEVNPGFDVGAHWHGHAEEIFYIVEGELQLLAFHPAARAVGDWLTWEADDGATVYRGGPGSFMYVPAGCPHAFFNPTSQTARMLFLVSPAGHERYLRELSELIMSGTATPEDVAELRLKHDIHQLTPLQNRPVD
ncbi:cupin domain-containing protein [Nocardia yunnanensis]|uniref:Cupin domain-containing protein n=1 Tax=Nocardia yunnanensis TaxID=2382165 RepID=A0A386ZFJ1_9NOCA|nr:cupin domain-containing protein [Nocardia yunnanensis]AYF75259.1 cupin domain-containing protein [Nocardia yunnanensis]